jgi:hypothetical protein
VIPVSETPVFERRQGLCHAGNEHYGAVTGRCQRREAALVTTIAKKQITRYFRAYEMLTFHAMMLLLN